MNAVTQQKGPTNLLAISILVIVGFIAIGRIHVSSDTKSSEPRAEVFKREFYQAPDGKTTLTTISSDECELRKGEHILLCK